MIELDYHQHQCPYPVVETRKAILANPNEKLQVLVADQISCDNIRRLAVSQNYQMEQQSAENGFQLTLIPGPAPQQECVVTVGNTGKTVIICASEKMGDGAEDLGRILLKNFFVTLTELDTPPETILFVNSGVKLACQGSEALEALAALACQGVDIASCGLCLDFYRLQEKLQVGRTTNMLEIAEAQLQAARIIKP